MGLSSGPHYSETEYFEDSLTGSTHFSSCSLELDPYLSYYFLSGLFISSDAEEIRVFEDQGFLFYVFVLINRWWLGGFSPLNNKGFHI